MSARPVEVLVVDDSPAMRALLVRLLEADPALHVAGAVDGGLSAIAFLERAVSDVVLMDIHLDGVGAFEACRQIMETRPLPIVMCWALDAPREIAARFRAFEAGAVAVVQKPPGADHFDHARIAAELRQTLRLMAEVKVVRRWPRGQNRSVSAVQAEPAPAGWAARPVVAIGASTGGPPALQAVLAGLPKDYPLPILVTQHIAAGFVPGLAEWLRQTTPLHVQVGSHGIDPKAGHVYLAPDDFHMGIDARGLIRLDHGAPDNGLRPSVDHLFRSVAEHSAPRAVGVLLTGMGRDGAAALKLMNERGARTIAQDRETSVVHGMPGAAVQLKAADEVLPLERIAPALCRAARLLKTRGVAP